MSMEPRLQIIDHCLGWRIYVDVAGRHYFFWQDDKDGRWRITIYQSGHPTINRSYEVEANALRYIIEQAMRP